MGKHRNKHRNTPGVVMTPDEVPEPATEQVEQEAVAEEQSPGDPIAPGETIEDVIAKTMAQKGEQVEATEQEAEPETSEPDAEESGTTSVPVKHYKEPARKVMSEELLPTRLTPAQKCVMSQSQLHTPAGLKLLDMFKEYEAAMSIKTTDRYEHAKRAKMLYAIVQQACPYKLKNTQVGKDLVMIFFDQLMKGWGKIYTDSTIFRLDYSLGQPAAIDKMDIFTSAIIQLIEAATGESDHISFQNDRLAKVIDSPAVMTAVENLRIGIEKRLAQKKK